MSADLGSRACCAPADDHRSGVVIGRLEVIDLARVRWAGGGQSLVAATDPARLPAVDVLARIWAARCGCSAWRDGGC